MPLLCECIALIDTLFYSLPLSMVVESYLSTIAHQSFHGFPFLIKYFSFRQKVTDFWRRKKRREKRGKKGGKGEVKMKFIHS